jgi:hypothetical protein
LVFYLNPNYRTDGWRYLEAAPSDQGGSIWSDVNTHPVPATSLAIGAGPANTATIINQSVNSAAYMCSQLNIGGLTDWFMPSQGELNEMYQQLYLYSVGGFSSGMYWSSSDRQVNTGWCQYFTDGGYYDNAKSNAINVRAIRAQQPICW